MCCTTYTVHCIYCHNLSPPISVLYSWREYGRRVSPEHLLLSASAHPNWGIMAISVEGMFVFREKAKPQISVPHGDTYKNTHQACAWACPRATPAKINTAKVIAIPIIARPILSVYCTVSGENAQMINTPSVALYQWNEGTVLLWLMPCTYLFILFYVLNDRASMRAT